MNRTITIETLIEAPIEKVWSCWNEPMHITQWCYASPEWYAPAATNDLKVGGKFSTTMAAKDGSMSFDFWGIYDQIVTNELIAYTMGDGRKAKIIFSKLGDATKIVETFEAETQNTLELQKAGWQSILFNFKIYTENK